MNRSLRSISIWYAITFLLMISMSCHLLAKAADKPNVILIMADDMGYSGITPFGGIGLETPALDKLASEGVICTKQSFCINYYHCSIKTLL